MVWTVQIVNLPIISIHFDVHCQDIEDICFFLVKDRNLFHLVNTIGNIFTSENITNGFHEMK